MKLFKKITAAVLCGVIAAGSLFVYNGYGEQMLRIGLERYYMGVSSVTAENNSLTLVFGGTTMQLDSSSGFKFEPVTGGFGARKQCGTLENALNEGNAVYDSEGWGSYLNTGTKIKKDERSAEKETETVTETAVAQSEEENTELTTEAKSEASPVSAEYEFLPSAVKITYDGGSFVANTTGSVTLTSSNGVIDLGEMSYRGKIEITSTGSSINTVNILTMDQYLYGVVPAEVYDSWPAEALKAQAVAARTYAQYHIGKHSGYDLCDHTHCQQYSGYNIESISTNTAVDNTSGVMAYYNGTPINSVYFDCDGGCTLSAAEVWGSDIPYLQSVEDPYELGARKWEKTFTLNEITALAAAEGYDIGTVTGVSVTKLRNEKLVEEVTLTGTKGTQKLTGAKVKTFFQKDGENILSRCFTISGSSAPSNNLYVESADEVSDDIDANVISAIDSNGEITVLRDINCVIRGKDGDVVLSVNGGKLTEASDSILLSGAGWGHGVGMSQCGAYGMAAQGYDYKEILKHYYKGIEVK